MVNAPQTYNGDGLALSAEPRRVVKALLRFAD
jgi:hypothetical protein